MRTILSLAVLLTATVIHADDPQPPRSPDVRDSLQEIQIKRLKAGQELLDASELLSLMRLEAVQRVQRIDSVDVPIVPVGSSRGDRGTGAVPSQSSAPAPVGATEEQKITLTLPAYVSGPVGASIKIPATTNATAVTWWSPDPDLNLFPVELLRSSLTAVVSSLKPGTYRILGYAALDGMASEPAVCVVNITGMKPTTPDPVDPVIPDPVEPDNPDPPDTGESGPCPGEVYGMATATRDAVLANVPESKRKACVGFAANHAMVAARIAAKAGDPSKVSTLTEANAALKEANRVTAGSDLELWTLVIKSGNARMNELAQAGTIDTKNMDQVRVLFTEIAAGFLSAAGK